MGGKNKPTEAYKFLKERAESKTDFSVEEIAKAVGWAESTPSTYINKKWRDYLIRREPNRYQVKRKFLRVAEETFLQEFSQVDNAPTYNRERHARFVQFEFLLPLTREDKLRRALDDLFYKDTIRYRAEDIGLDKIAEWIPKKDIKDEEEYLNKVVDVVGSRFGGYSIIHVQGRYKAASLMTRREAAEALSREQNYLIDETTASVRFIIPCETGASGFEDDFQSINQRVENLNTTELEAEVALIRTLFFQFFVEAVVASVHGEEEIWLLETGHERHLYRWCKTDPTTKQKDKKSRKDKIAE